MECKKIGGVCDKLIEGNTPDDMHENWKQHATFLARQGDEDHREAIQLMQEMSGGDFAVYWLDLQRSFDEIEEV